MKCLFISTLILFSSFSYAGSCKFYEHDLWHNYVGKVVDGKVYDNDWWEQEIGHLDGNVIRETNFWGDFAIAQVDGNTVLDIDIYQKTLGWVKDNKVFKENNFWGGEILGDYSGDCSVEEAAAALALLFLKED